MTSTLTDPAPETLHDAAEQSAKSEAGATSTKARAPRKARAARKRTAKPKADTSPKSTTPRPTSLAKRLEDSITTLGAMLLFVSPNDGQLVIAGARKQAVALDSLARENPAVRRALERMMTASVYGQLAAAFAPTLLGIAANHGMLPPAVNGLVQMATAPAQRAPSSTSTTPDAGAGAGSLVDLLGGMSAEDLAGAAAMAATMMGAGTDGGAPRGAVVGMV